MSIRIGNNIISSSQIPDATTTEKGIVRFATDTEIEAGTSTDTVVTPYQLANAATKTQVDDVTITKDDNDVITSIGVLTKSNSYLYDWIGTLEEYNTAVANNTIQSNWLCYITDDYEEEDYSEEFAQKANIIWYPDKDIYYKNNQYLKCDKQTLTINGDLTLKIGELTKTFYDTESYTITSLLDTGTSLTAGKDYCIYLTNTGNLVVSLNSTYPTNYTEEQVRKIGGFHTLCVSVTESTAPTLSSNSFWSAHPAIGYSAGDAIPNSTWTLAHKPYSEPNGMVYIDNGDFWVDIYLQSGTYETTSSIYGGTLTNSRQPVLHEYDMILKRKKLPTDNQFTIFAEGSNQQTSIYGGVLPSPATTGGHTDANGARMISGYFVEECCGYVWQWLDEYAANGQTGWQEYSVITRGSIYGNAYVLGAGGRYSGGSYSGSWSRTAARARLTSFVGDGARGVSFPSPKP